MPATQKAAVDKGAVWLAISSTHSGASDYMAPAALAGWMKDKGGSPTATLMDADGKVGRAYGAKVTPHMYVIDPKGTLVYAGAIDDKRIAAEEDLVVLDGDGHAEVAQILECADQRLGLSHDVGLGHFQFQLPFR